MKIASFVFVFIIMRLVAGMVGCERMEQVVKPATQTFGLSGEITIGVVLPQTGVFGPSESGPGTGDCHRAQ